MEEHFVISQTLFYGSHLVWPFIAILWWFRHKIPIWMLLIVLIGVCSFVYARFIEPAYIVVTHTTVPSDFSATYVVVADMHLGVYKSTSFLERVVSRINTIEADAVLIPGDFTYKPGTQSLTDLFSPLTKLNKPVYAVLGNHDVEQPGLPIRTELEKVLVSHGVRMLTNETVLIGEVTLVGLGDRWAGEDDVSLLENLDGPVVLMTHNPDTVADVPPNTTDLMIAGHTHCGQVRVPFLYQTMIPTKGSFDGGLTREETTDLFITCGVGEVGLPLRFLNPPTIDVLHITARD